MEVINTIGRRKTSVARIYMTQGSGSISVNDRDFKEYFPSEILQKIINQPFEITENGGKFDVKINVKGGGITGQADAVKLAIARALCEANAENRPSL